MPLITLPAHHLPPAWISGGCTAAVVLQVRENSDVGTFVAHLSVVDADSGDNGRFVCSVDDRNFALQPIYTSELKLVTSARLDRERRDEYQLSISCRDFGATPLTSVVPLSVKVCLSTARVLASQAEAIVDR